MLIIMSLDSGHRPNDISHATYIFKFTKTLD